VLLVVAVVVIAVSCLAALVASKKYDLNKKELELFKEWLEDNPQKKNVKHNQLVKMFLKFQRNVKKMKEQNKEEAGEAEFGPNGLSDLSDEEFRKTRINSVPLNTLVGLKRAAHGRVKLSKRSLEATPKSKDWRKGKGRIVTRVKNQGSCGSCWAFATVANVESVIAMSGKKLKTLSEQQLVDCSTNGVNNGCNGGWQIDAFKYLKKKKLHLSKDYKYTAKKGKCKHPNGPAFGIKDYLYVASNTKKIKAALVQYGPLAALVDASKWQHYRKGVLSKCGSNLNHAVLIVGYGKYKGKGVYIVKNSWGKSWGAGGYAYVKIGNTCGIEKGVCTAVV